MIVMDDKKQPSQTTSPAAAAPPPSAQATAPPPATAQAAEPAVRRPKVGDKVWLHTSPGRRYGARPLPATIKAVIKPTVISLKTDEGSEFEHEIIRSQFDPTGAKPDSWRFRD
jgi:hypothetical protein